MKFCISYNSSLKKQADEIKVPVNQLGTIWKFAKENPQKRYIIQLSTLTSKNQEQIDLVRAANLNYSIEADQFDLLSNLLNNNNYNAYFKYPATEWETYKILQNMRVSDIYIDAALGFQTKALRKSKSTNLRISPTFSPTGSLCKIFSPYNFFIRPEDLYLYESTFDIIDFNTPHPQEDTLFEIYKNQSFLHTLDLLFDGASPKILNPLINKNFAKSRLNCGQKCFNPLHHCNICRKYLLEAIEIKEFFDFKK